MAQSTVLAAGLTAATSSDIVVAAGATVTVGLFSAVKVPAYIRCAVHIDGPTGSQVIGALSGNNVTLTLSGPGTFFVTRPAVGVSVGVFTEA